MFLALNHRSWAPLISYAFKACATNKLRRIYIFLFNFFSWTRIDFNTYGLSSRSSSLKGLLILDSLALEQFTQESTPTELIFDCKSYLGMTRWAFKNGTSAVSRVRLLISSLKIISLPLFFGVHGYERLDCQNISHSQHSLLLKRILMKFWTTCINLLTRLYVIWRFAGTVENWNFMQW